MVTRPLDLLSRLRKPPANLDAFYFVNAGLIALFFGLFGSRFVISPGILLGEGKEGRDLTLPAIVGAAASGRPTSLVIRVVGRDVVLAQDGKFSFEEYRRWILEQGKDQRDHPDRALLVLADISLTMKDLVEIYSAAEAAGFRVELAANDLRPATAQGRGSR